MTEVRVGPSRMPSRESPEEAVELLRDRGYRACEIDFETAFWMDYPFAERLGEVARENDIALSVHAPLFGFMGHVETTGRKFMSAEAWIKARVSAEGVPGRLTTTLRPDWVLISASATPEPSTRWRMIATAWLS